MQHGVGRVRAPTADAERDRGRNHHALFEWAARTPPRHGPAHRDLAQGGAVLGKCGGLKKKNEIGDLILPIAAIAGRDLERLPSARGSGAAGVPAAARVSTTIRDLGHDHWKCTVFTTNRRFGNTTTFSRSIWPARRWRSTWRPRPSSQPGSPMKSDRRAPPGVGSADDPRRREDGSLDLNVTEIRRKAIKVGLEALKLVRRCGRSVKHLRFSRMHERAAALRERRQKKGRLARAGCSLSANVMRGALASDWATTITADRPASVSACTSIANASKLRIGDAGGRHDRRAGTQHHSRPRITNFK